MKKSWMKLEECERGLCEHRAGQCDAAARELYDRILVASVAPAVSMMLANPTLLKLSLKDEDGGDERAANLASGLACQVFAARNADIANEIDQEIEEHSTKPATEPTP